MPVLPTRIDTRSESYQQNREAMTALMQEVREAEGRVRAHGEAKAERFASKGKLLPRERVERVLDPGSPFLELSTLAGFRMHDDDGKKDTMGGGNIAGIGFVAGVRCLVVANDSAIKGGTVTPMENLRRPPFRLRWALSALSSSSSARAGKS